MRNCFSNCTTWRSKKRTTAALRTLFSQLHAFPTALRSCASLVSIFRPCHAVCIASVAACSSESVRACSTLPIFNRSSIPTRTAHQSEVGPRWSPRKHPGSPPKTPIFIARRQPEETPTSKQRTSTRSIGQAFKATTPLTPGNFDPPEDDSSA